MARTNAIEGADDVPIIAKRRKARTEAEVALTRLQEVAREQAERVGPYADQARDPGVQRPSQPRGRTGPRLEPAAQSDEDTVAPRVADLLTTAAQRRDPAPPRRVQRALHSGLRRVRRTLINGGAALV